MSGKTANALKAAQAQAVDDRGLRGSAFGRRLSEALDEACREAATDVDLPGRWVVVALGSYARREQCPGSDIDIMLVHDGAARGTLASAAAEALWFPLWDAGFVLGHSLRTPKEAVALAREDVDTLTGLLDVRAVTGDEDLAHEVVRKTRELAQGRQKKIIAALAERAAARHERPGPIAEMLAPNLKDGTGGLRDIQALEWAGWTMGEPGGVDALVKAGILQSQDPAMLDAARARLLEARVELHRVTGTRSDVLELQEQDAVAAALEYADADALVRDLSAASRAVTWVTTEVWRRLRARTGRGRSRNLQAGVVERDGVVALDPSAPTDAATSLTLAAYAADKQLPIERGTLERLRTVDPDTWNDEARTQLITLLRAGSRAIPVVEALDQVGALVALVPEWSCVQARPQRNAYHRFTVDRHLLECVAECARLLDEKGFDGDAARRCRTDLLLLGALLHDIGKGIPGDDHSITGARAARVITERIGLDAHGVEVVDWLVQNHLLLADTATRRDLADEETIIRVGRAVRDTERLDLLYALTVADSCATGPAAWSSAKAVLVRQLFLEADALLERGVVGPGLSDERLAALERNKEALANLQLAVAWEDRTDGLVECTVVAPDRTGLLATVTAVLALHGFDIRSASAYGDESGMALEVYRGVDTFERLDDAGRRGIESDIDAAINGTLPVRRRLDERIRRYRHQQPPDAAVEVRFDLDASSAATVCEVHAPDAVGLLARIAAVFADLEIDVNAALVSTLGERVVDVFYVQDSHGAKITDPAVLERLRATIVARLSTDSVG
ncbi:MAG: ACT domain-containing protein [Actinobacteria bacterium]|nr:ACT domain-containing protein [Actinomycetota bacterium]